MAPIETNLASDVATNSILNEKGDGYHWKATSDELAAKFSDRIKGKTIIITGVSPDGLGAEAARAIAQHEPKLLILASRSSSNISDVVNSLKSSPRTHIKPLLLDLADQDSVRKAAAEALATTDVVDVLINNAAVMMLSRYNKTPQGIEMHFGINHIGHFLFTNLIVPALLKAPDGARIINISSAAYRADSVNFEDVNFQDGQTYDKFMAYARSKTANLLFSVALAEKLGSKSIQAFSVDPGASAGTKINREIPLDELKARGWWDQDGNPNPAIPYKTSAQSVSSYIMAAFDPAIADKNGSSITACSIDKTVAPHARDAGSAEKLWTLSEKLVGEVFEYE